jgi:hypothetical protein
MAPNLAPSQHDLIRDMIIHQKLTAPGEIIREYLNWAYGFDAELLQVAEQPRISTNVLPAGQG